jgi:hypothetical protein
MRRLVNICLIEMTVPKAFSGKTSRRLLSLRDGVVFNLREVVLAHPPSQKPENNIIK